MEIVFVAVFATSAAGKARCASHQISAAEGSYGSIATEMGCPDDVRFPPVSDQTADIAGCLKRANSGSDAYSRSKRRQTAIALNRYRGNPHLERVALRWEVSFHYNRRAREN